MKNRTLVLLALIPVLAIALASGFIGYKRGYRYGHRMGEIEKQERDEAFYEEYYANLVSSRYNDGLEYGLESAQHECDEQLKISANLCNRDLNKAYDLGKRNCGSKK